MITKKFLGCLAALVMTLHASAQVAWDTDGNTVTGVSEWFGADASSTAPLRIETRANQPIDWYTDAIQRMMLNPSVTGPMGPGTTPPFTNVPRDGFLLLSGQPDAFTNAASRAPFTRLHLIDDATGLLNPVVYAQQHGYRPWQRNGITFTGNSDQSYLGHKYDANDNTDFVLQWSDNPESSPWGTDRFKIVFTTQYSSSATKGAATMEGVEAMRFWPKDNVEVNVGIGDFAPTTVGDPTERLDILDGRLRIRDLPEPSGEATSAYKVMVVDDAAGSSGERGVVKWVDPLDLPPTSTGGGADCDWNVHSVGPYNVRTAYAAPAGTCPSRNSNVGIGIGTGAGTTYPQAKLHVLDISGNENGNDVAVYAVTQAGAGSAVAGSFLCTGGTSATGTSRQAGSFSCSGGLTTNYATHHNASCSNGTTVVTNQGINVRAVTNGAFIPGTDQNSAGNPGNYGVWSEGFATNDTEGNCKLNHGGYFRARWGQTAYGVYAKALQGATNYGIYATIPNAAVGYAGYIDGNLMIAGSGYLTAGQFFASDATLKTDIEPITSAMDLIGGLRPKTYRFDVEAHRNMTLPEVKQWGFLAQEVHETFPELVKDMLVPAVMDSLGNETHPAETVLSLNYTGMIPILVAGMQEQQGTLEQAQAENAALSEALQEMRQRMDQMEQALATCCNRASGAELPLDPDEGLKSTEQGERLLRIDPNPFTDRTTLRYTLERGGRAMLLVNSSDGKQLQVLHEAAMQAGEYQQEWQTSHLAPGIYYVTLLLDGEPLVKRAVKVR